MNNKLNTLKFALAGGIWLGLIFMFSTVLSILNVPGFVPFSEFLNQFYGSYGYSISWIGSIIGGILGFAEGFVQFGLISLIYNWLNKSKLNQS
jgi:hypothetical protein